jgi:hypothetical protein
MSPVATPTSKSNDDYFIRIFAPNVYTSEAKYSCCRIIMSELIDKHVIELLPAYALGSLEEEEAGQVSSHLAASPQLHSELAAYRQLTDLLPLAATQAEPEARLKSRLMQRVGSSNAAASEKATVETPLPAAKDTSSSQSRSAGEAIRSWLAGPVWRPVALYCLTPQTNQIAQQPNLHFPGDGRLSWPVLKQPQKP